MRVRATNMDTLLQKQLREAGYTGAFDLGALVEACGDGMHALIIGSPFSASGCTQGDVDGATALNEEGSTPTEAVAMLWLALQTKSPR